MAPSRCFNSDAVRDSSGRITAMSSLRPLDEGKHTDP